jgi:hypothetical protein
VLEVRIKLFLRITEGSLTAQHRRRTEYVGEGYQTFHNRIQISRNSPVSRPVGLVTKGDQRDNLLEVCPTFREYATNTIYRNIVSIIVLLATTLSELSSPERFVMVHFEAKKLQSGNDGWHNFYGDDDVVTIDTHPTLQRPNVFEGKVPAER